MSVILSLTGPDLAEALARLVRERVARAGRQADAPPEGRDAHETGDARDGTGSRQATPPETGGEKP